MRTKQLNLKATTDMFGTNLVLASKHGDKKFTVGTGLQYNPVKKLKKTLDKGYLFRSPNLNPDNLDEIWPTIEGFDGDAAFSANVGTTVGKDGAEDVDYVTAFMRIADKSDATMFAYSHSLFEKWSDAQQAEAEAKAKADAKRKPQKVKLNADGTVTVKVDVTILGD